MALRIGQFVTTCHVPRSQWQKAGIVDELVRGRFPKDLGDHLGPSLARQPAIVRVRRLTLRVVLPAPELNEESLSRAWVQAFSKALFTALAYPTGAGPIEIFRADSLAGFLAGAIRDLLLGVADSQWYYAEFKKVFELGSTQASLTLLCEWPQETLGILFELSRAGVLDQLLGRFDDPALETVFRTLAAPVDAHPEALSFADLITAARLLLSNPPGKVTLIGTRRYALRLFITACLTRERPRSARGLYHSLYVLSLLITQGVQESQRAGIFQALSETVPPIVTDGVQQSGLLESLLLRVFQIEPAAANRLPPAVLALMETIVTEVRLHPQSPRLAELIRLTGELRTRLNVPPPLPAAPEARTFASDWCGLFFLAGTLNGLNWIPAWRALSHFRSGGISCLIAGLALSIVAKLQPEPQSLDPGLALFAGYLDEPDCNHLRRVMNDYPRDVWQDVLEAAIGERSDHSPFDRLANVLIQRFAERLRGFKQAAPASIVRTFLQRRGRIRVDDHRIVVIPEPSPFHVVLHIAGLDAPQDSLSWVGGRRLEFEVGDL